MRQLRLVLVGSLLVVLDLRVNGVDVLPDPLGWLLAAVALLRLRALHVAFRVACAVSAVGVLVALPGVLGPETGLLAGAVGLLQTVLVLTTCTAVHALLPDDGVGRVAGVLRWVDVVLAVATVPLALLLADGSAGGAIDVEVALPLVVLGGALTLGVVVTWLVVLALASGREPSPGPSPEPSPEPPPEPVSGP